MLSNNISLKLPLEPAINFYYMIYEFFQFSGMSNIPNGFCQKFCKFLGSVFRRLIFTLVWLFTKTYELNHKWYIKKSLL